MAAPSGQRTPLPPPTPPPAPLQVVGDAVAAVQAFQAEVVAFRASLPGVLQPLAPAQAPRHPVIMPRPCLVLAKFPDPLPPTRHCPTKQL